MRWKLLIPVFAFSLLLSANSVSAQSTSPAPRDAQAVSLLRGALAGIGGAPASTMVQDATFSGTVRHIAGSLDESGAAMLKGTVAGASLTEFDLPSGTLEESRNITATPPSGAWSRSGGASQPIGLHNLATDPTWFYPVLLIERALADASYGITYVGTASKNDTAVIDVRINSFPMGPPANASGLAQTLGQMDLYLDAKTNLPVALDFNGHPDKNALVDLPFEIRYLNYASQAGALVPSEIQQYINNSLLLDIQVTSAQFNTGLTTGALVLQ